MVIGRRGEKVLHDRYAAVRYPARTTPAAHPSRMAALARLHRLDPPQPRSATVVDLGCGEAADPLAIAASLPGATVYGLDADPGSISDARSVAERAGLSNLALFAAEFSQDALSELHGKVDYVLMHGVLSWVPDEVRATALGLCANLLRPGGIAFLGYNALPGWHLLTEPRRIARDAVARSGLDSGPEADPVRVAECAIDALQQAISLNGSATAYVGALQAAVERYSNHVPAALFHDDLAEVCVPLGLREISESAQRVGLAYLCEAAGSQWWSRRLPPSGAREIRELSPDPVERQIAADGIAGTTFKQTLLFKPRARERPAPEPEPESVDELLVLGAGPGRGDGTDGGRSGAPPTLQAVAETLETLGPAPIAPEGLAASAGVTPETGAEAVLRLVADGGASLWIDPPAVAQEVSERPVATGLARDQARRGIEVTSLTHNTLEISDEGARELITLLDGTRSVDDLVDALAAREVQRAGVESALEQLHGYGLLAGG